MKYWGSCERPSCRTANEWVQCGDCDGTHCANACPVPVPVYVSLDPLRLAAVSLGRMRAVLGRCETCGRRMHEVDGNAPDVCNGCDNFSWNCRCTPVVSPDPPPALADNEEEF